MGYSPASGQQLADDSSAQQDVPDDHQSPGDHFTAAHDDEAVPDEDAVLDEELAEGARNAVRVCLRLQPHERVTVVTDRETLDIAKALVREIEAVGSDYSLFILEDYTERPTSTMPAEILADLSKSQVSIFAAQAQTGELPARMALTGEVNRLHIRHGHMVNIDRRIMRESMRADYNQVDRLGTWLLEKAERASYAKVTSPRGTNLEVTFSPRLNWLKTSGIISPDKWGNLPGGEVFTSPQNVNGHFVVDGVVGDYLCKKYGDLSNAPLVVDITKNRITDMTSINEDLLKDVWRYVSTEDNSQRVGEFAFGTNLAAQAICGNILQDEKIPGVHMAFGHPYPQHTGQSWEATTHLDCVGRDFDIWIDDELIMSKGTYLWPG